MDPATSWQELAIQNMKKPDREMYRKEQERTRRFFLFCDYWRDTLLLGFWLEKKVSWLLLRISELAGFHPNIWLLGLFW